MADGGGMYRINVNVAIRRLNEIVNPMEIALEK